MKKVLILPSPTGHGDLMIAKELAMALRRDYAVETVLYDCNRNSPFAKAVPGPHVVWPNELAPDHSADYAIQIDRLATVIRGHGCDVVISLNEIFFGLAAHLAGKPVIQITHFCDSAILFQGREVLEYLFSKAGFPNFETGLRLSQQAFLRGDYSILKLVGKVAISPREKLWFKLLARTKQGWKRLITGETPASELTEKYRHLIATNYLSQLFCDEAIVHSIFAVPRDAIARFDNDRALVGKPPLVLCNSFVPEALCSLLKNKEAVRLDVLGKHLPFARLSERIALVTFGGIDHPITDGVKRMVRVLEQACDQQPAGTFAFLLAGRIIETRKQFFESAFSNNRLFRLGQIKFIGSIPHEEHLKAIVAADLVVTQPGYSTLCEIAGARKPCVLFYGMAPYYEQYINFVLANRSGLCLTRSDGKSWMQVGEYKTFGSSSEIPEDKLVDFLSHVLKRLGTADSSLDAYRAVQELSLNRHQQSVFLAVQAALQRLQK